MTVGRTAIAGGLAAVLVAALIGGWVATGWPSVRAEADAIREAPRARAAEDVRALASSLSARLEGLRASEGERPYYQYQNLYHDPRGASAGLSVVPSPLASGPDDPLISSHFQIDRAGELTIPTINEELPELSEPTALAENRELLAELRAASDELGAPGGAVVAAAEPRGPGPQQPIQQQQNAAQIQAVEPQAYAQNVAPNVVYQQVKKAPNVATPGPAPARSSRVQVVTHPLAWRTAEIAGHPRLVATRAVETPDGALVQGFVVDHREVTDWLGGRGEGARLVAGDPAEAEVAAPVAASGGDWQVAIDPSAEMVAAADLAAATERGFWWRVVPASLAAIVCAAIIVLMVARADRLARQRSRFAAAAAHELRTPLAGLQLYGDMLADGLGDPERAGDYARRIADEAARLGRVVANVLGFTQLERGALSIQIEDGDAADAARRAVSRTGPALEHAGVELEVDLPDRLPARFDDDAVQRILQNLLDNAEKYTRERERRRVTVSGRAIPDADAVDITVTDDGPGVPKKLQRQLFAPFARGADDDGPAGLGLGLALSLALARAQGGALTYAGASGGGAAFTLRLPA